MDKPPARVDGARVAHLGHASFLLQVAGLNILIDPVYSERASPFSFFGPKRVNAPGVAQAVRKALTRGFRPAFAVVERKFGELDALILQFGTTPTGRSMIAAWKDARLHKGANGPGPAPAPTPPAPPA